ncbi:hypothetical protein GCM10012275_28750 [Longimycelium tulufanense]|uniref:Uncharacterized protein n=1 Tax=Longimycelium tulufanense TaxID=907463 RepID=A0A8J3CES1_9PSEU|nr:hypothetical protein GCM10012275_28750 [Longimycelium tulufanense]
MTPFLADVLARVRRGTLTGQPELFARYRGDSSWQPDGCGRDTASALNRLWRMRLIEPPPEWRTYGPYTPTTAGWLA